MPVDVTQASDLSTFCKNVYRQHYEHLWQESGSTWYQEASYGVDVLQRELLSRVYLSNEFTGQGTGRRVLSEVCSLAMDLQRQYVWLHVMDSSEAAIRFYTSLGFEIAGETMLPFELMKSQFRRMLRMRKVLGRQRTLDAPGSPQLG